MINSGFPFDQDDPLSRCPGETLRANIALRDYINMGGGRSFVKLLAYYRFQVEAGTLLKPPVVRLPTLKIWSANFAWQLRLQCWYRQQAEADRQLWLERRKEIGERDFAQANALRDLADKIIKEGPNFIKLKKRTYPAKFNDKGIQIEPQREVITMALDGHLLVQALSAASDLQRRAAGLDERLFLMNVQFTNLTDDQLLAISNGSDILSVLSQGAQNSQVEDE